MPLGTTAELDFMLEDSGDEVRYGSAPVQTTHGHLDRDTIQAEGEGGMQLIERAITLVIRDGSLTGLKQDREITVNDEAFLIRDIGTPDTEGWRRLTLVEDE